MEVIRLKRPNKRLLSLSGSESPAYNFEQALSFDGIDDFAVFSATSGNIITISTWVKFNSFGISDIIIGGNDVANYFRYQHGNSRIQVRGVGDDLGVNFDFSLLTGVWYHVFYTSDGGNCRCYVNGVESVSGVQTNAATSFDWTRIGQQFGTTRYLSGLQDDLVIWEGVTGAAQNAVDLYNGGAGVDPTTVIPNPKRWYKFNNNGNDSGSDGQNLTITGATFVPHTIPTFDFGNALVSDGVDDFVALDNTFLDGATKFSINFWAKGDESGDSNAMISKISNALTRIQVDYNEVTTDLRVFLNDGTTNLTTFSEVYIGAGDMVTVTFDGSLPDAEKGKAYLNGSFLGNCSTTIESVPTTNFFELQRVNIGGAIFPVKGNLNEVGIVDGVVFTPVEISSLWNGGNGAILTDIIGGLNSTNARYYRCNETAGATELVDEIDVANNGAITGATFTDWNTI